MPRAARAAVALIALALGCATGGTTAAPAQTDALAARFERAEARRAAELAPDLHARAERARKAALAAGDPHARADHAEQAELLLDAALAEAERIALLRAAAEASARELAARGARADSERTRLALAQQARREQSAQAARAELTEAFAPARAGAVQPRPRAELLRERATLLLAAAIALGLPEARAAAITQRIDAAASARPAAAPAAAESALAEAERGLGEARAARPAAPDGTAEASADETSALLELARERGLTAEATANGVAIAIDLRDAGAVPLEQLAAVARAHPRGAIAIEALAPSNASPSAQRDARARAERLAAQLGKAAPGRVQLAHAQVDASGQPRARLLLPAYRLALPSPH